MHARLLNSRLLPCCDLRITSESRIGERLLCDINAEVGSTEGKELNMELK